MIEKDNAKVSVNIAFWYLCAFKREHARAAFLDSMVLYSTVLRGEYAQQKEMFTKTSLFESGGDGVSQSVSQLVAVMGATFTPQQDPRTGRF